MATLLAHLVRRFSTHPENLASEALAEILNQSPTAAEVVGDLFTLLGLPRPETLSFYCQAGGEDLARPDVIGQDNLGAEQLIVEAKFWAGLTSAQPVEYFKRVPAGSGMLLFVCPADRMGQLWPVLLDRCRAAGMTVRSDRENEPYAAIVADDKRLALLSWRYLLQRMRSELIAHREQVAVANIEQLIGLTEEMDTQAFKPLRSDELWTVSPLRLLQLHDLVDRVTDDLVAQGTVNTQGLRATAYRGGYGRYMNAGSLGLFLRLDFALWFGLEGHPIWLQLMGTEGAVRSPTNRLFIPALGRFRLEGRLYDEPGEPPEVGLKMPLEQEETVVIESLSEQVSEIIRMLREKSSASG